jgi:DNA-binding NarL/FixJ family response regulator
MITFQKILIAEDYDTINSSLVETLRNFGVPQVDYAKYCDDALLKIKKSAKDNEPYDLLLSDLSFPIDSRQVKVKNGEELMELTKLLLPKIKIITYSIEDKGYLIKKLFHQYQINAFVHKGRNSLVELKNAILSIQDNKNYISPSLQHLLQENTIIEMDSYDIQLIQLLANGLGQEELEMKFKKLGVTPNSRSAIEKRISKLKDYFKAKNTVHLIAIAKDLGIA